jgi:hypothetical protein
VSSSCWTPVIRADACVLGEDSEGVKGAFVWPDFSSWFLKIVIRDSHIPTGIAGCWWWWLGWLACSSRGRASSQIFICLFRIFCEFCIRTDMSDVLLNDLPHFYIAGKSASANGVATNAASLGTTYDVISVIAVFQSVILESECSVDCLCYI